jgi:hypothetical protein
MRRLMDVATAVFEVSCLVALGALGLAMLPIFCVVQALQGDPFWFMPSKSRPAKGFWNTPTSKNETDYQEGRGGYYDTKR